MELLDQIAFIIENKGWKNCHLIDFVVQSVRKRKLQGTYVDEGMLKKLEIQMKKAQALNNPPRGVLKY
jgi:hypothetical protein